jgi:hypothetical protein
MRSGIAASRVASGALGHKMVIVGQKQVVVGQKHLDFCPIRVCCVSEGGQ